jgi:hypothetical protein
MTKMKFRDLTTVEQFPQAFRKDLLKIQSEHFVSNALADGSIENGYKNMPFDFPSLPSNSPLIVNSEPPKKYIITYIKNNWRPLLIMLVVGGGLAYVYVKSKEKNSKKSDGSKNPKPVYYNLPKQSI